MNFAVRTQQRHPHPQRSKISQSIIFPISGCCSRIQAAGANPTSPQIGRDKNGVHDKSMRSNPTRLLLGVRACVLRPEEVAHLVLCTPCCAAVCLGNNHHRPHSLIKS